LVGGPLHWDYVGFGFFGISAPATWVIVISELGLLTLAVITVVRDRRAWAGWAMLAMSVLPCIGLVALGRLTMQGTSIGRDYHYFSLTVAPALAGVLLAMSSAWPAAERPWGPPTRAGAPRPAGPWQAGVVLAAVVLVASGFSSASYARHWSQLTADRYLSTVASQVTHQAEASPDGRVTLLDEDVPASVFSDYLGPKTARLSRVLPTLGVTNVSYDGVADSLFRADATGHVAAARLTPVAQLTASGSRCTASGQPRTVTFRSATPLAATTAYVVRLLVQESAATNLRIKLLANHQPLLTGFYDDSLFTVPAGNHAVAITEIGASFDEVRISFDATTYACVTTAEVDAAH
jgi:hypothetical protein